MSGVLMLAASLALIWLVLYGLLQALKRTPARRCGVCGVETEHGALVVCCTNPRHQEEADRQEGGQG
jgi:hypothetical protein